MDSTQQDGGTAKILIALFIGLIVGFAAGAFWQAQRQGRIPETGSMAKTNTLSASSASAVTPEKKGDIIEVKTETVKEPTAATIAPLTPVAPAMVTTVVPRIVVENQTAGASVEVASVTSAEPVWVAVRELKGGKLGNILGVQKSAAGESSVSVDLLRPTVKGESYAVVLYRDSGDPAFNYREDVLIGNLQGVFVAE